MSWVPAQIAALQAQIASAQSGGTQSGGGTPVTPGTPTATPMQSGGGFNEINGGGGGIYEGGPVELYDNFLNFRKVKSFIHNITHHHNHGSAPIMGSPAVPGYGGDTMGGFNGDEYDGLFGIAFTKKAKERLKEKRDLRAEAKRARIYNLKSKADSRLTLAQQGIVTPSGVGSALSGVASLASTFMGGGGGQSQPDYPQQSGGDQMPPVYQTPFPQGTPNTVGMQQTAATYPFDASTGLDSMPQSKSRGNTDDTGEQPEKKQNKNLPFIIGGAVILVIIIMVMMKRKK